MLAWLRQIGPMEWAVIVLLALVVFGPRRLPEFGRSLGQAIRELRNAFRHTKSPPRS